MVAFLQRMEQICNQYSSVGSALADTGDAAIILEALAALTIQKGNLGALEQATEGLRCAVTEFPRRLTAERGAQGMAAATPSQGVAASGPPTCDR